MSIAVTKGFAYLDRMADERGLFEHADGTEPREEHGYCTDDNARLLVVASRETDTGCPARLARLSLRFVRSAQDDHGRFHNRMDRRGRWTDEPNTEDCWGRAMWGLGSAAVHHTNPSLRRWARRAFERGLRQRSPWPRAMAFATLGVADVAIVDGPQAATRAFLSDALQTIGSLPSGSWRWPEARLRYANASMAEAVLAAGVALESPSDIDRGLRMLEWLLQLETAPGHLSVVGAGGRGPDDLGPQFDQQPIEVAAMADACWRAHRVTGDAEWSRGVLAAEAWFEGANDVGLAMRDEESGGSFDGLHEHRVNLNEGAESTLALISTFQRADWYAVVR